MYANVSWPGWACLAVSLLLRWEQTPFHNSMSIKEHTLSFLRSHLLMKLGYVWESDQLIFHPFPKYLLMMCTSSYWIQAIWLPLNSARVQQAEGHPKAVLPKHRCTLESLGIFKNHCCLALILSQCDLVAIGCELGSEIFKCSPYRYSNM